MGVAASGVQYLYAVGCKATLMLTADDGVGKSCSLSSLSNPALRGYAASRELEHT